MLSLCLALSHHFLEGDWNEVHPCVRYQNEGFIAGAYYNSESNVSAFVGWDFGNLEVGLVTGYSGGPVVPMVRGTYDLNENLTAFVSPAYNTDTQSVGVVLGLEFRLGL